MARVGRGGGGVDEDVFVSSAVLKGSCARCSVALAALYLLF